MIQKNKILKCILILCFLTIVDGNIKKEKLKPRIYQVIESKNRIFIQNDENNDYDPDAMVRFLNKNADLEYKVNNKTEPKTRGLKRILIKRKIPHGLETHSLEYDHLHNALYRPLVRYHKTKKNYQNSDFLDYENTEENGKNGSPKKRHQEGSKLKNNRDFSKQLSLQPFYYDKNHRKRNPNKNSINSEADDYTNKSNQRLKTKKHSINPNKELTIELLKELNELTRSVKSTKRRRKIREEVSKILDELQLRTGEMGQPLHLGKERQYLKSGTQNDPFKRYDDVIFDKHNEHAPFYVDVPLTNFWTYKKTIPMEDCPGQLIKIGNVCAKAPPH